MYQKVMCLREIGLSLMMIIGCIIASLHLIHILNSNLIVNSLGLKFPLTKESLNIGVFGLNPM